MNETTRTTGLPTELEDLKNALDALSPNDFAAWTAWVESRLTERLSQRQAHGRASASEDLDAPAPADLPG